MTTLSTTDPRTGTTTPTLIEQTTPERLVEITTLARDAFRNLSTRSRAWRAGLLQALADGLEEDREALVSAAMSETGLPQARLTGELTRSIFQLRLFADVVTEGGYLEAIIDHAGDTPLGPGPDVRRMLVPLGPVAVFGASNFPFAFSVVGGDTASALAAGGSVVIKAHGSHLLTSQRSYESLARSAAAHGAPEGTIGIVYGQQAGADLVRDPRITAVGFTGSLSTGKILQSLIDERPTPIPFYGELSSVNPLIVTAGAVAERGEEIAEGLYTSFTASAGQLCTKPGIALVPEGEAGDALAAGLVSRGGAADPQTLLNSRIHHSFDEIRTRLIEEGHARSLLAPRAAEEGFARTPAVLEIDADHVTPAVTEEAFGPLIVLVRYRDLAQIGATLAAVPDSLTATIHSAAGEAQERQALTEVVRDVVGRIIYDGYPTGVRVCWAMHHGGPWPATNTQHTSVGATAVRRFLRPLAWQDAPQEVLPPELREGQVGIPRRVDGVLRPSGS
ncbi:aldehyde dehydrogenase (NADP(+)) [Ruania halotolerans]|uniref:aldehyde dehydrogenase (NADP(+)) n=1 Tax=Ruania halotolerans TaxID=2897773 RepID=UPI001E35F5B4|nr:aldehyde dehydrogenase (NADP(+)) [Ruania halotolerans]UFU06196.1 aldehyde dehydrogenase (NADP(+)) [Ruania halotolerans]